MSYIGQNLPTDVFGGYATDTFAGDGSATTFTLSQAPFNEQGLIVVINNVIQQPTTNYTVSGTTLTIVGTAVASGDVIYARHTGVALPIGEANALDLQGQSDKLILDADADTTISADTDDQIDFKAGGTDVMSMTATGLTINDGVEITTADNTDTLILTSTDADANSAPNLVLKRNSGSPADSDQLGYIHFKGENDADEEVTYYKILSHIADASNGTEDANVQHQIMMAGTLQNYLSMNSGEVVVNDGGVDVDFRVENDDAGNLLRLQAYNTSRSSGQGTVDINSNNADGNFIDAVTDVGNVWSLNITHTNNGSSHELYGMRVFYSQGSPDGSTDFFLVCQDSTTTRLRILSDGDVVNHDNSYGSISDERIKQGIRDASSQWDDIKALKVRNFKKNDDVAQYGDKAWEQIGVVAQELEAAGMDKCVHQEVLYTADDEEVAIKKTAKEGDVREYKSVKYSVLYMKAIKALQEAMTKIETLETKVKALEDA
jgi:hypothetical protein